MIVVRRKPFINSTTDKMKLKKYKEEFNKLKHEFELSDEFMILNDRYWPKADIQNLWASLRQHQIIPVNQLRFTNITQQLFDMLTGLPHDAA